MAFALKSSTSGVAMRRGAFKAAQPARRVLVAPCRSTVSEIVSVAAGFGGAAHVAAGRACKAALYCSSTPAAGRATPRQSGWSA
jgi:hypothetical protein